jgi:hypothetical protein
MLQPQHFLVFFLLQGTLASDRRQESTIIGRHDVGRALAWQHRENETTVDRNRFRESFEMKELEGPV